MCLYVGTNRYDENDLLQTDPFQNQLFTVVMLLASLTLSAQSNLVVNPGFYKRYPGWSTDCTIEINPESVYGGANSNPVSEIDIERCLHHEIATSAGAMYDFSFKAGRRQGGTPATVGITVKVTGIPSGTVYINQNLTYTNTSWGLTASSFSFTPFLQYNRYKS